MTAVFFCKVFYHPSCYAHIQQLKSDAFFMVTLLFLNVCSTSKLLVQSRFFFFFQLQFNKNNLISINYLVF